MLPKPELKDVDETSLTLAWPPIDIPEGRFIRVQYKLPHETWDACNSMNAGPSKAEVTVTAESQVADLVPGMYIYVLVHYILYHVLSSL